LPKTCFSCKMASRLAFIVRSLALATIVTMQSRVHLCTNMNRNSYKSDDGGLGNPPYTKAVTAICCRAFQHDLLFTLVVHSKSPDHAKKFTFHISLKTLLPYSHMHFHDATSVKLTTINNPHAFYSIFCLFYNGFHEQK